MPGIRVVAFAVAMIHKFDVGFGDLLAMVDVRDGGWKQCRARGEK